MGTGPETVARVCVDIMIIALIGLSAVMGWRKGFASVLFSIFRWIFCIVASILGSYPLKGYLMENTGMDESISTNIKSMLLAPSTGGKFFSTIPEQMQDAFSGYQQSLAARMAMSITDRLMNTISFLFIMIAFILITGLIQLALSRRGKRGPVGMFFPLSGCSGKRLI